MSEPLRQGELVRFVINDDGETRPALVVKTWGPTCANIHVFWDGMNDWDAAWKLGAGNYPTAFERGISPWMTSATYDLSGQKRTMYREEDTHIVQTELARRKSLESPKATA